MTCLKPNFDLAWTTDNLAYPGAVLSCFGFLALSSATFFSRALLDLTWKAGSIRNDVSIISFIKAATFQNLSSLTDSLFHVHFGTASNALNCIHIHDCWCTAYLHVLIICTKCPSALRVHPGCWWWWKHCHNKHKHILNIIYYFSAQEPQQVFDLHPWAYIMH